MKLVCSLTSPYARKVRVVAAEKKIDLPIETINVNAPESPAAEWNPLGKVPVLVLDDGATLFDSRVIVEFLDTLSPIARLIPADNRERIDVRRWEALADGVLDAGVLARMESLRPANERSNAWLERQLGKVSRGLAAMDRDIGSQAWCAGNGYSLADIAVGACLGWIDFRNVVPDWRKQYPNLARHAAKLWERTSFIETAPRE